MNEEEKHRFNDIYREKENIIMCYYNVLGVRHNKGYWKAFDNAVRYLENSGFTWSESEGRYTY